MMDNCPQDAMGLALAEADPNLFEETRENLESGSLSDAAAHVTDEQRAVILANLLRAKICKVCACGQADCRTYNFERPPKDENVPEFTIRFHVRGELLMYVTANMDVIDVERLYDLNDEGEARTVYGLSDDGIGDIIELDALASDET